MLVSALRLPPARYRVVRRASSRSFGDNYGGATHVNSAATSVPRPHIHTPPTSSATRVVWSDQQRDPPAVAAQQALERFSEVAHTLASAPLPQNLSLARLSSTARQLVGHLGGAPFLPPELLSLAFFGLRDFSCRQADVRTTLIALVAMTARTNGAYTAHDVSRALYGLRNCMSTRPEVRASLAALTRALEASTGSFTPRDVSHALNGLRSSSASVSEVRAILAALAPRIAATAAAEPSEGGRGDVPSSDVALALQGLRYCQGSHTAVGQGQRGSGVLRCH